jgi:hypothetical protein
MPLTGPIPEGHSFFCPSCGALYAVTYSRASSSDSNNTATCGSANELWLRRVQQTFPPSSSFTDLKMPSGVNAARGINRLIRICRHLLPIRLAFRRR